MIWDFQNPYNARLDDELTDENDFSAISIGSCSNGYCMMLCSGYGRPNII